jgi:hypothetical protein
MTTVWLIMVISMTYIMYIMKETVPKFIKVTETTTGEIRVTIPIEIVRELGLKKGDYVVWYIETDEQTGEKYAAFKKAKIG